MHGMHPAVTYFVYQQVATFGQKRCHLNWVVPLISLAEPGGTVTVVPYRTVPYHPVVLSREPATACDIQKSILKKAGSLHDLKSEKIAPCKSCLGALLALHLQSNSNFMRENRMRTNIHPKRTFPGTYRSSSELPVWINYSNSYNSDINCMRTPSTTTNQQPATPNNTRT